jgi:hypothetical protein
MKVDKYRILPYYSWPPTGTYPEKSGNLEIFLINLANLGLFFSMKGPFYRAKSYFSLSPVRRSIAFPSDYTCFLAFHQFKIYEIAKMAITKL